MNATEEYNQANARLTEILRMDNPEELPEELEKELHEVTDIVHCYEDPQDFFGMSK